MLGRRSLLPRLQPSLFGASGGAPNSQFSLRLRTTGAGDAPAAVGDILRVKTSTFDTWLIVDSDQGAEDGRRHYRVHRLSGGTGTIHAGTPVLNYGQAGQGLITLSSNDLAGSPKISMARHYGSPWSGLEETVRIGNLTGLRGIAGTKYGMMFGNIASGASGSYIAWDGTSLTVVGDGSGMTNIDGANIQTGTVTADKISVSQLAAIVANLGQVFAGDIVLGDQTSAYDENTFTGLRLYKSGATYRLEARYAGALGAIIDSDGPTVYLGTTYNQRRAYRLADQAGTIFATIDGVVNDGSGTDKSRIRASTIDPLRSADITIEAYLAAFTGSGIAATASLRATARFGASVLTVYHDNDNVSYVRSTSPNFRLPNHRLRSTSGDDWLTLGDTNGNEGSGIARGLSVPKLMVSDSIQASQTIGGTLYGTSTTSISAGGTSTVALTTWVGQNGPTLTGNDFTVQHNGRYAISCRFAIAFTAGVPNGARCNLSATVYASDGTTVVYSLSAKTINPTLQNNVYYLTLSDVTPTLVAGQRIRFSFFNGTNVAAVPQAASAINLLYQSASIARVP